MLILSIEDIHIKNFEQCQQNKLINISQKIISVFEHGLIAQSQWDGAFGLAGK
jgi:hypothetical protein